MKPIVLATVFLFGICFFGLGCSKIADKPIVDKDPGGGDHLIAGKLVLKSEAPWKAQKTQIEPSVNLVAIDTRVTEKLFTGGGGAIFESADGGKNWNKLASAFPKNTRLQDIFFVSRSIGWALLQDNVPDTAPWIDRTSRLMKTTNGGQTWVLQLEAKSTSLNVLRFPDENNGWLAGFRYTSHNPDHAEAIVLITGNSGRDWHDVSTSLNLLLKEANVNSEGVSGMVAESAERATIVSGRGRIYETLDSGLTWGQINIPHAGSEQISNLRLRTANSMTWLVGGTAGLEGIWGLIVETAANGPAWQSQLDGYYFKDALFIDDQQILACGFGFKSLKSENPKGLRDAVILYSSDKGRTWSRVYFEEHGGSINAIEILDPHRALAVGDDGAVLQLERP